MTATLSTIFFREIARANTGFIEKLLPHLTRDLFENKPDQIIFHILTGHLMQYRTPPSLEQAQIALQATKVAQEFFDDAGALLKAIYKPGLSPDDDWLKDNLQQFVRDQRYRINMDKHQSAECEGKEVWTHLENALLARDFKIDAETCGGLRLDPAIIHRIVQDTPPRLRLKSLKDFPSMARGELGVAVAESTGGKTALLVHMACDFLAMGFKVLYITLENSESETLSRCVANLIKHDKQKLKEVTQAEFEILIPQGMRNLRIVYRNPGSTADHFDECIRDYIRLEGFRPDILIVDYLGKCGPSKKQSKSSTEYEGLGDVTDEIRDLAIEYKMIAWTAAQSNRQGVGAEPSMTNIADSFKIIQNADIIINFSPSKKIDDHLLFKTLKNRNDAKVDGPFTLLADFSTMTFSNYDAPAKEEKDKESASKFVPSDKPFKPHGNTNLPRALRPKSAA